MSVRVNLYFNRSDRRVVEKDLQLMAEKDVELKGDVDVAHPTLILTGDAGDYAGYNYMQIGKFGRYYFLDPPLALPGGMVEITGHVDILSTCKDQLYSSYAIVERNETFYNLYLNDGTFQAQCNDKVVCKEFTGGFSSPSYVLILAG